MAVKAFARFRTDGGQGSKPMVILPSRVLPQDHPNNGGFPHLAAAMRPACMIGQTRDGCYLKLNSD